MFNLDQHQQNLCLGLSRFVGVGWKLANLKEIKDIFVGVEDSEEG